MESIPLSGLSPGLRAALDPRSGAHAGAARAPGGQAAHAPTSRSTPAAPAFLAGGGGATSGVMEWRARDLEKLAASLPRETWSAPAALDLHTALAFRLWATFSAEADAQVAIGRAVLARDPTSPGGSGPRRLSSAAASPCGRSRFSRNARASSGCRRGPAGAGISYELTAFPDGLPSVLLARRRPARPTPLPRGRAARPTPGGGAAAAGPCPGPGGRRGRGEGAGCGGGSFRGIPADLARPGLLGRAARRERRSGRRDQPLRYRLAADRESQRRRSR
jgi:hypothetical protein